MSSVRRDGAVMIMLMDPAEFTVVTLLTHKHIRTRVLSTIAQMSVSIAAEGSERTCAAI